MLAREPFPSLSEFLRSAESPNEVQGRGARVRFRSEG